MENEPVTKVAEVPAGSSTPAWLIAKEYAKTIIVTLLVALSVKAFVLEAFRIPSGSMENTLQVGDFLLVNKLAYGFRTPGRIPLTNIGLPSVTVPWRDVRRGDVVVFEFPNSGMEVPGEEVNFIKRCIGLPGDTVELKRGRVFINGRELLFSRTIKLDDGRGMVRPATGGTFTEDDFGPVVVPRKGEIVSLSAGLAEAWRPFLEREGHVLEVRDGDTFLDGRKVDSYIIERDYYFMLGDNRRNSLDSRFWGFVSEDHLIGEALMVYWSWDPEITFTRFISKVESIRWDRIGMFVR